MIDSMFYGILFDYTPFHYDRVVDMFYSPIIDTTLLANFPLWGRMHIIFFRPIFNFADSYITCGVIYLLLSQWEILRQERRGKVKQVLSGKFVSEDAIFGTENVEIVPYFGMLQLYLFRIVENTALH